MGLEQAHEHPFEFFLELLPDLIASLFHQPELVDVLARR